MNLIKNISSELDYKFKYEKHIFSINKVRNCIEHRDRILTKMDCNNDSKDELELKWLIIEKNVIRGSEKFIINESGFPVKCGDRLTAKIKEENKSFKIGEIVKIDLKTLIELALTGYLFIEDVAKNVYERSLKQLPPQRPD